MAAHITVIVNVGARKADDNVIKQQLAELFNSKAVEADIQVGRSGTEIVELARYAAKGESSVVVAGGGDGTVNAVASELVGTGKILGVLPLGTLNHFAKDLCIPLDIESAVDVIAQETITQIDIGEVNGRYFLNNSSIGLYPQIVQEREIAGALPPGKGSVGRRRRGRRILLKIRHDTTLQWAIQNPTERGEKQASARQLRSRAWLEAIQRSRIQSVLGTGSAV